MANRGDYRVYGYGPTPVNMVNRVDQIKNYLDDKFDNIDVNVDTDAMASAITTSLECVIARINDKLDKTNEHIENVKHEIVANIHGQKPCGFVTKEDVQCAIETINANTDERFEDLNEQVKKFMGGEG